MDEGVDDRREILEDELRNVKNDARGLLQRRRELDSEIERMDRSEEDIRSKESELNRLNETFEDGEKEYERTVTERDDAVSRLREELTDLQDNARRESEDDERKHAEEEAGIRNLRSELSGNTEEANIDAIEGKLKALAEDAEKRRGDYERERGNREAEIVRKEEELKNLNESAKSAETVYRSWKVRITSKIRDAELELRKERGTTESGKDAESLRIEMRGIQRDLSDLTTREIDIGHTLEKLDEEEERITVPRHEEGPAEIDGGGDEEWSPDEEHSRGEGGEAGMSVPREDPARAEGGFLSKLVRGYREGKEEGRKSAGGYGLVRSAREARARKYEHTLTPEEMIRAQEEGVKEFADLRDEVQSLINVGKTGAAQRKMRKELANLTVQVASLETTIARSGGTVKTKHRTKSEYQRVNDASYNLIRILVISDSIEDFAKKQESAEAGMGY